MRLRLFHVSETPGIAVFEPRPVPSLDAGVAGDAVWAIDEEHLPNYLLPRDCPRVTYCAGPGTTAEDRAHFIGGTARRIIVVEEEWQGRIASTPLYVYEMPLDRFLLADASAGYYVSREAARPVACVAVSDPLAEIAAHGCETRFTAGLRALSETVKSSTLDFSIVRIRNAGLR